MVHVGFSHRFEFQIDDRRWNTAITDLRGYTYCSLWFLQSRGLYFFSKVAYFNFTNVIFLIRKLETNKMPKAVRESTKVRIKNSQLIKRGRVDLTLTVVWPNL